MTQQHSAETTHGETGHGGVGQSGAADVEPPPPPRPLTAPARARSWAELRVRLWLIVAVMILVVTVGFAVMNFVESQSERWLIDHGQRLDATLSSINETSEKGQVFNRSDQLVAVLKFTPPGGQPQELQGFLYQQDPEAGEPTEHLVVGQKIPIFIDPNDPTKWTDRLVPRKWTARYVATVMTAPVALLLLLLTAWQRRGVLKQWRSESAHVASVISWKATAIAPRSYLVAMALVGGDARIFEVLIPKRAGVPQPGDEWWVIPRRGRPRGSIVAAFYASGSHAGGQNDQARQAPGPA
jgi:hypothetical protein